MTKKYIHKTLQAKKEHDGDRYYIEQDGVLVAHSIQEEFLQDFGFIEAPTEEVKGDKLDELLEKICEIYSASNNTIERSRLRPLLSGYLPKPVEQELIPLDNIDKVIEELKLCFGIDYMPESHLEPTYDTKSMKAILSKYGVHKQEEKAECSTVQNIANERLSTPTPQATSVDVGAKTTNSYELMLYDIESMMYTQLYTLREQQTYENRITIAKSYLKKRQDKGFLGVPIQKKFTKQYVREKMSELPYVTSYIINQTYKFLEKEGILSD